MPQQFTNNARAVLASTITDTATSIVVDSASADLFPVANTGTSSVPAATNWFKATLQDSAGHVEIVYVRTRASGSAILSNVIRGQESTTALAFTAGTVVGLRVTAADLAVALAIPSQNNAFTGTNTFSGANSFTAANDFTGAATATTKTFGNSSTALATTAFVQEALQALHPVGSIYINAGVATNPATLFGFGTWAAFGAGKVLVGLDSGNAAFDTVEETGGSADAIVVTHNHTATVTDPGHFHNYEYVSFPVRADQWVGYAADPGPSYSSQPTTTKTTGITVANTSAGASGTNANLQPYIVVYMWKRTA
jgi:hypothetical protein